MIHRHMVVRASLSCMFAWAALAEPEADAPESYTLTLLKGSRLWLEGDSTLHAYQSEATTLLLKSAVSPGQAEAVLDQPDLLAGSGARVDSLVVTAPLKGMKSGIVGLAGQLQGTLKHKQHPDIVFVMKSYAVAADEDQAGSYVITALGDLSLAGATNAIEITMSGEPKDDHLAVKGEKDFNMTDFGVTPPTLLFGAIKTADKVVVKWDLRVSVVPAERSEEPTQSKD